MKKAYVKGKNVITSLGFTAEEVFARMKKGENGFRKDHGLKLAMPFVPLSLIDDKELDRRFDPIRVRNAECLMYPYSRLEKLFAVSIHEALRDQGIDPASGDTLLMLPTTKGNIGFLEEGKGEGDGFPRLYLWQTGEVIRNLFRFSNEPVVISNACVSGSLAIGMAARFVRSGTYRNVIVSGADVLSEFIISGFISFQALSPEPCRPFDKDRDGLSLGEGCGTLVISSDPGLAGSFIEVAGFASSNDANHISGPSRTGEELAMAIRKAADQAGMEPGLIGFISAHGTGTAYNDEMESKAFALSGVSGTPMNSFKGYFGHTLGAAGIIESALAIQSMEENFLIASAGFREEGVPEKVNVIREHAPAELNTALKTASGFGGCNTALVFRKFINGEGHE